MSILRIVGDRVEVVEERITRTVGVDAFLAEIEANLPVDSGMLPRNCLYFQKNQKKMVYVVEVPAGMVSIVNKKSNGELVRRTIAIPFTQFYIAMNSSLAVRGMRITVTKHPVFDVNDKVFVAP